MILNQEGDVVISQEAPVSQPEALPPPPAPANTLAETIEFKWSIPSEPTGNTSVRLIYPAAAAVVISQMHRTNHEIALTIEEAIWLRSRISDAIAAYVAYQNEDTQ